MSQSGESTQNLFNLITILNYFHFLTQENIGFKLSEILVGSGIRKKPIPDPGSRIQGSERFRIPDPGSGSATLINRQYDGEWQDPNSFKKIVADPDLGSPKVTDPSVSASGTRK